MPSSQLLRRTLITATGGGLGMCAMVGLAFLANLPLLSVPFTTSIVLVMSAPDGDQAQPRAIVGGHILSALCGLCVLELLGSGPWLAALAVGLSIAAMQLSRTLHPPAGINAFLMVVLKEPWTVVLMPVAAGALILVGFAFAYYRLTWPGQWPRFWWAPSGLTDRPTS
jgi:CBS-domain-containing membrane protein